MRYENVNFKENDNLDPETLSPSNPREKWLRKRTHVKLRVSLTLAAMEDGFGRNLNGV